MSPSATLFTEECDDFRGTTPGMEIAVGQA